MKIIKEIGYIMGSYGISIDYRHLMLLSEVMTYKGTMVTFWSHSMPKHKRE